MTLYFSDTEDLCVLSECLRRESAVLSDLAVEVARAAALAAALPHAAIVPGALAEVQRALHNSAELAANDAAQIDAHVRSLTASESIVTLDGASLAVTWTSFGAMGTSESGRAQTMATTFGEFDDLAGLGRIGDVGSTDTVVTCVEPESGVTLRSCTWTASWRTTPDAQETS